MKEMIKEILREEMGRMNKTFYFISGLPRSGSSVLSSILNQNPKFYSGSNSPVLSTMIMLEQNFSNDDSFNLNPKPEQAREIISSVLPQYYSDRTEPIIFDKSIFWTFHMKYIEGYFGIKPKVICPVRSTDEILTSFISAIRRNPIDINGKINFIDEQLVKANMPLTDDNRCEFLASSSGTLGQSIESIRKALMEGYDSAIHFVEYQDLINSPEETMNKIYEFLDEEYFHHDFNNLTDVTYQNEDTIYGFSDVPKVRPKLESTSNNPKDILSKNILEKCKDTEFWRILDDIEDEDTESSVVKNSYDDSESTTMIG